MKTSETITKISASINKAQSKFMHVVKDVQGARGLYASLPAVIESVRPVLNDNGITVLQQSQPNENGICLSTVLLHTSGEWIADEGLFIPCVKNDPQAFGSAMSYARRYSLLAMLGVAADDDDGKMALDPPKPVSGEQQDVLYQLTMLAKPEQNKVAALNRVKSLPADQFVDYALMGVERLHDIPLIVSSKRDRLVQMIRDGESILNELEDVSKIASAEGDE